MKKWSLCLLVLLLSAALSACGTPAPASSEPASASSTPSVSSSVPEASSSSEALPQVPSAITESSESSAASDVEMQRVGSEEFGYVDIPATWIPFYEVEGGTDLQYTDGSGVNIITMNLFSTDGLTEEQKAQVTAETAAQSVWYNMETNGNGKPKIEGARGQLCGYEAYQVYAMYEDGTLLVTWSFEASDGKLHYLAAEGTPDAIFTTMSYLENSWSLEK